MILFLTIVVLLYITCDLNYLIRTIFCVWCGRLFQENLSLSDVTTIYGLCTFQDCDVWFKKIRLARLVRELDFARYHFYDRTGIYQRSQKCSIKSLQGSTLTFCAESVPLFVFYKIKTKLVYWDERSLFLEHEVITLHDNRVRYLLVSRQFALGKDKSSTAALLKGLSGSERKPTCPKHIKIWLESMEATSKKLRQQFMNSNL